MATVQDVAAYILSKRAPMTAMKLQKLIYYSQAWSLVWDDEPLFPEAIEAWANGPVCPALYRDHRQQYELGKHGIEGNIAALTESQVATIDGVLGFYGDQSSQWLSDLTHMEAPWKDARGELAPGERGNQVIELAAMKDYYESLGKDG